MGNTGTDLTVDSGPVIGGDRTVPLTRSGGQAVARRCARAAAVLGASFAAISVSWGLGSTWLLDTVGGALATSGRAGAPLVIAALWTTILLKAVGSVLPLIAVSPTLTPRLRGPARVLCWIQAVILTGYGVVLTTAGLLVQTGVITASADADHVALAWHSYLWDPWFAAWGVMVALALILSRPNKNPLQDNASQPDPSAQHPSGP